MKDTTMVLKSYIRQQQILAHLGYYNGKIDGKWGPKTVEAKKEFERSKDFKPCVPNFGHPFENKPPFPQGISYGEDGLMVINEVSTDALPKFSAEGEELLRHKSKKPVSNPVPFITMTDNNLTPVTSATPFHKEVVDSVNGLTIKTDIL